MLLDGAALDELTAEGVPRRDGTFLVWFHGAQGGAVVMPHAPDVGAWRLVIDSAAGRIDEAGWGEVVPAGTRRRLVPEGLSVWAAEPAADAG